MKRVDFGEFEFDRSDRDLEREPRRWRTMGEVVERRQRARAALDAMSTTADVANDRWSRFASMWEAIGHYMRAREGE